MHLLSAEQIAKSYGEKILFQNVTFGIEEGDKIGVIGVNGTGKSTFLKVIAGLEQADAGKVTVNRQTTVRMLAQEPVFTQGETVLEHVLGGDSPQLRAVQAYTRVLEQLELNPSDTALQQQLINVNQQMDEWNAWTLESDAKSVLTRLGLTQYDAKIEELSGGQRKRAALAAALLLPSDVLILDEPTNHIDNDSVAWLEEMLQKRRGALLMITHDRYFLDRVSNRVIELDQGEAYFYEANYSRFLELKLEREEREAASEAKRQNLLRKELAWIRRGAKARTTKQKARKDRYEALKANGPKETQGKLELSAASTRLGRKIVELHEIGKSLNGKTLINNFSFIAVPEDRVGIVGRNGLGKSTLLKIISGELEPDIGTAELGMTVKLGIFTQEHDEMDEAMRAIEYIRQDAEQVRTADGTTISAAQMLERFLFAPTMQWTPIAKLSGGEKRRLQLLRVLMNAPNVLLLDEPTNDLDIATLTVLEQYLDEFPGVVFTVSHDRYFLDRVADTIIAFEGDGLVKEYEGNYSDYAEAIVKQEAQQSSAIRSEAEQKKFKQANSNAAEVKPKKLRMSYQEQRDYEQIEDWIADAEDKLGYVQQQMEQYGSDAMKLQELMEQQQQYEQKLEQLMDRWAELNELVEQIEASKNN